MTGLPSCIRSHTLADKIIPTAVSYIMMAVGIIVS